MEAPFFTIAVPTKNRARRLADTIRGVLEQSFADFELVICDNSDVRAEADANAELVRRLSDRRLRYVSTGGQLSMPDNWERAIAEATGRYVGIVTDRSVLRPDALTTIRSAIDDTEAPCVSWFSDLYGRDPEGKRLQRRSVTFKRYELKSERALRYFLEGHPKYATKIVPKLMTSVCSRELLASIRASAGRCCLPIAPDFTSGFLILAHCESILVLDEAMYVSCGTGTGAAFRMRGDLAESFRRELGVTWSQMVREMPSTACFSHALVLNDFLRVRSLVPDRLARFHLDHFQYYVGCMNDYLKTARHGVRRDADMDALLAALEQEPDPIRSDVRSTKQYAQVLAHRGASAEPAAAISVEPDAAEKYATFPRFETVFDALAWDAANPREPAAQSFLDALPDAKRLKRVAPPHVSRPRRTYGVARLAGLRSRITRSSRLRPPLGKRAKRLRKRLRRSYRSLRQIGARNLPRS